MQCMHILITNSGKTCFSFNSNRENTMSIFVIVKSFLYKYANIVFFLQLKIETTTETIQLLHVNPNVRMLSTFYSSFSF